MIRSAIIIFNTVSILINYHLFFITAHLPCKARNSLCLISVRYSGISGNLSPPKLSDFSGIDTIKLSLATPIVFICLNN